MTDSVIPTPLPQRVRNDLVFRQVTVKSKTRISNCFYRLTFGGDALSGFTSRGFDDHIKLFFPDPASGTLLIPTLGDEGVVWPEGPRPAMRDYTPLAFDAQNNLLTIDFYIHDHGIASRWAAAAHPGDILMIGGPRGSLVVPTGYRQQIYVCDETGLPAVQRRLNDLAASPAQRQLSLFAFSDEQSGLAYLHSDLPLGSHWLGNGAMHGAALASLQTALEQLVLGDDYFIWITGEGAAVKQLADAVIATTGAEKERVRAVAYWHAKSAE